LGRLKSDQRTKGIFEDRAPNFEELYRPSAEKMPEKFIKVIVNPVAGSRSVGREWPLINQRLLKAGLSFDFEFTKRAGHAMEIAKRSADIGYSYLIAVGGDGTVSEVANGILSSARSGNTVLGIVGTGTAHAFTLSLGITKDYVNACSLSTVQGKTLIDVGVVRCRSRGQTIQRFFVNEASVVSQRQLYNG
jgi:diacylglycerol kinase (ATP)